jgi:tRNA U34 2-thiouridine synthase MnmA/TrmU
MNRKAVALFSGGLDSSLAIKLILEQGIEVVALHFFTPFCTCNNKGCNSSVSKVVSQLGIKLKTVFLADEYFEMLKKPKFGYGSNLNPCIDCRILILRKAKEFMEEVGASFIVTGEVLNQRPMSQRLKTLKLIEREAGVEGLVVRPLSAKVLPITIPESVGIVDRDKFLGIVGRGRKVQLSLAEEYGIEGYGCPSGGCLLTDPSFARRMKDLMIHNPGFTLRDVMLLKVGRHFRISDSAKLVVGRDKKENNFLEKYCEKSWYLFSVVNTNGPRAVGVGELSEEEILVCCKIVTRYADKVSYGIKIEVLKDGERKEYICNEGLSQEELEKKRI